MKQSIYFMVLAASFGFLVGCSPLAGVDDDVSFINSISSGNYSKIFDITDDNSGLVKITPLGEGFSKAVINFGHGSGSAALSEVKPGQNASHAYPEGTYSVVIDYYNLAGSKTSETHSLSVIYRAPEDLNVTISGETRVKATAKYAKSFLVYYGDVANETGTPMAIDQELPAHTYPATGGPFTLRVVALSGGLATTSFSKTLFGFPIDFDAAGVEYFFGTFGGGQKFETTANPNPSGINTSAKVGKFIRGYEGWSGTYSPMNIPINFSHGKKIKVMAYNAEPANIGKKLNVELEWSISGPDNGVAVLKVPVTKSGEWEELEFDFSGISGIPADAKFTQLVLRYNDSSDGTGDEIYLDNFRLTN